MDGIAIDTDLRERCIEAMERAISEDRQDGETKSYMFAVAALDACLSVLADHAYEWIHQAWRDPARHPELTHVERYIQVLREDT